MSSFSSEPNDGRLIIDLSSHNIGSRLNDSLMESNLALYASGMQERSSSDIEQREEEERTSNLRKRQGASAVISSDASSGNMLLSPYEEREYLRSLHASPTAAKATPVVTLLGGNNHVEGKSIPYMTDFQQFGAEQERNHKKRRQAQDKNDSWINNFSKWSSYSKRKLKISPNQKKSRLLRTNSSIRRKDFTVKSEVSKFDKDNKFIFHKGFATRLNAESCLRRENTKSKHFKNLSRFQNEQELLSFMRYINVNEMDISEVVSHDKIRMFLYSKNSLKNLILFNPKVKYMMVPLKQYNDLLLKSRSKLHTASIIKRPSIRRRLTSRNGSLHRSMSLPIKTTSLAEKSNPELYQLWNAYLRSMISKRIELRISCLIGEDISSFASTVEKSSSTNIERSSTPAIFPIGSSDNPIVVADDDCSSRQFKNMIEINDAETDYSLTRPTTSIFSKRQSITSTDQNRKSFYFPLDSAQMNKIDEEFSLHSVTSRNTLA